MRLFASAVSGPLGRAAKLWSRETTYTCTETLLLPMSVVETSREILRGVVDVTK